MNGTDGKEFERKFHLFRYFRLFSHLPKKDGEEPGYAALPARQSPEACLLT